MATLGRPFRLGMLYDMRSDKIIAGATLWDPQNLANNTSTFLQPYTGFEVITDDSLQNKAHALGVEASLKLSMVGGLVDISGSAKYAENFQQTRHETRLSLKYSTTTRFEQLTMKHLSKINLDHPDLHDVDLATHVVTGVLYGAEAFFVFDRTITKDEDKRDISGTLKVLINKIPTFKVEGEGKLNMNDQQQKFVDRLNCKFYGDFQLSENPSTFADAIRIYRELPKLLGNKSESAVPKKVWLYPLSLLDNKGMRVVRDISSKLIDYTISILENLHSTEVTALDLSRDAIFTHFDHMKNHLLDFTARLSEFQRVLKEKIVLYLPQLRGNTGVQESVLFNLFKRVDSSPFNKRTLESWLNEKRQVISLVTSLLETLVEHKKLNVTIKSSSLHGINFDSYYDYTFCLSLRFVEENDPHLTDMHNYLYGNSSFKSSKSHQNNKTWFTDHRFMAKIRKDFRQFTDFAKANNVENRKIKFIVDEEYAVNHLKSTQLILYDDESEKVGFILPSKPSAPYVKNVTENNVTLGWTDGVNGSEKIIKYKVMYRQYISKLSDDRNENETAGKWITMETSDNRQEIIISNLSPTITFEFQAQSVTAIGLSVVSDLSEPVTMPGVKARELTCLSFFPRSNCIHNIILIFILFF
ncbi:unnamed protein product [Rotaria sp. Silwood2]|nr:unnamed protein product [Rotaria sp. Silwood2]CAF4573729.1 unnamed protein product [Rotaria sp. Silwood2]